MIGWDDVPHLQPPQISTEELDELQASMLPHQRQARRTGRPALGAGAVYQVEEDYVLTDPFPIPDYWPRAYGFDVGWNCTAACFGATDPDSGIIYITNEYYQGEVAPALHASGIRMVGEPWMEGAIDPSAENSNMKDGTKLLQGYEDLGLNLTKANNAVNAGIHECLTRMQGGKLKVFRQCTNWLTEFRLYRRDEKGKIVKQKDHLMDAMRYLVNTDGIWKTEPAAGRRRKPKGEW